METKERLIDELLKAKTVSEICRIWEINHHSSVIRLLWKGDIVGIQDGSLWLVSLESAIAWYGKPKHPPYI